MSETATTLPPDGAALLQLWRDACNRRTEAARASRQADETANVAERDLARWLTPVDANPDETFSIWIDADTMLQVRRGTVQSIRKARRAA